MDTRRATCLIGVLVALAAAAAHAQTLYRIVGPDGRVTYTDRPPAGAAGTPVGAAAPARPGASGAARDPAATGLDPATMAGWPAPLRAAATRFPVTLYAAEGCAPCDEARRMLQRRGVPYTEKRVRTEDDARRLEQLTGGRLVPAATIGRQALSGFQEQDWQGWLDSAGYPRDRMLPPAWRPAPVTALAPAAAAAPASPASQPAARPAPLPTVEPGPGPAGIRF